MQERYHEYILRKLKEERMKIPDTCCEYCRKVVPQPFFVVKHFGHMTRQLPFCDETCANEYYLEHLRNAGI